MSDRVIIGKVVKTLDAERLVLNKGSENGVAIDHRFIVYELGEEIFDPDTGENLGRVEIVKGTGKVIHIQERLSTILSDQFKVGAEEKTIHKRTARSLIGINLPEVEEVIVPGKRTRAPFLSPKEGDIARQIEQATAH